MAADAASRLDRYTAGELSRDEERVLAQAALDDPDLFDALMTESAARAAIRLESGREHAAGPFVATRTRIALLAAAAAVAIAILYPMVRTGTPSEDRKAQTADLGSKASPAAGLAAPPAILTARLEDLAGAWNVEFRSVTAASRAPKTEGAVTSVADGEAAVLLGSLDGVVQGTELDVYRGADRRAPIGRLHVVTVFRETARGTVTAGAVHGGDVALVPPPLVVAALRQRAVSLIAAGDAPAARAAAELALPHLNRAGVHVDDRRTLLALLGAIERRTAETDRAIEHLRAAAALLAESPAPSDVDRTETLLELGAALLEARNVADAERVLREARQTASGRAAVRVLNDLGAAAALRGDRAAASDLYRAALQAAGDTQATAGERRVITKNLADLAPSR
jgi:hypothetical protein